MADSTELEQATATQCRVRPQEQALTLLPWQVLKEPQSKRLRDLGTCPVVQQLRLHAPRVPGSVPGQGTKSHRPRPRAPVPRLDLVQHQIKQFYERDWGLRGLSQTPVSGAAQPRGRSPPLPRSASGREQHRGQPHHRRPRRHQRTPGTQCSMRGRHWMWSRLTTGALEQRSGVTTVHAFSPRSVLPPETLHTERSAHRHCPSVCH